MSVKAWAEISDKPQSTTLKTIFELKQLLPFITHGFIMFIMSACSINGEIFPFSAAYLSGVKSNHAIGAAAGGILGCMVFPMGDYKLKYIAAIAIISIIKTALTLLPIEINETKFSPFISAIALGIPSVYITVMLNLTPYTAIMSFSEVILAGGSSYFFNRGQAILTQGLKGFSKKDIISAVTCVSIIISGLYQIRVVNISLGGIAAAVLILAATYSIGTGGGAALGSALGSACAILSGNHLYLMAAYPLAGVMCGVFKPMGKLFMTIMFCIVNIVASSVYNDGNLIPTLLETVFGGLVFMAIPNKYIFKLISPSCFTKGDDSLAICHVIETKLKNCSKVLLDVKNTSNHVSFNLDKIKVTDISSIYHNVGETACAYCSKNNFCWGQGYNDTVDVINKGINQLKNNKNLSVLNLPTYFRTSCINSDGFVASVSEGYKDYIRNLKSSRAVARLRDTVYSQLEGVSMMIDNISQNVNNISYADSALQNRITAYFTGIKVDVLNCLCYADYFNRLIIEVTVSELKAPRVDPQNSALEISDICEKDLDLPIVQPSENDVTFIYREVTTYKGEFGLSQRSAYGQKQCGDYCKQFLDNRGNAYTILSDGMGNGKEAALQAAMTVDMLWKLIDAGADYKSAIHLVNSSLIAKSDKENLSTIDITAIDLYTGSTEVYKAGAAPTFLLKDSRPGVIRSDSLPVGIIKDVEPQRYTTTISFNDFVVTISDGVTSTGDGWIASQLVALKDKSAQEIAENLCTMAWDRRNDTREDDITVGVIKLKA